MLLDPVQSWRFVISSVQHIRSRYSISDRTHVSLTNFPSHSDSNCVSPSPSLLAPFPMYIQMNRRRLDYTSSAAASHRQASA